MGLKDIKLRMNAVKKTASITQAMHNIALSKIKKATELHAHASGFVDKIHSILENAFQGLGSPHRMMMKSENTSTLFILVTSDRGLCGSYHNNIFKTFLDEVKDRDPQSFKVFVLGKKGFYFAQKRGFNMINKDIIYNRDDITTMSYRTYAHLIKEAFMEGALDQVVIYYSHYINTATQTIFRKQMLPIDYERPALVHESYIYDIPAEEVVDQAMDIYIESHIFEALADAKLSEHASRMVAMKNATDNANDVVARLHTMYHRARQQEITSELIDVVNGSNV